MIADALRDLINASTVAASLARYPFSTGLPEAAIFTMERIPDDASYPAVRIDEVGGGDWGTRCKEGAECFPRVFIYTDKDWKLADVRALAWSLKEIINRAAMDVHLASYGYACGLCIADPPAGTTDDQGFPGYVIDVRMLVLQT